MYEGIGSLAATVVNVVPNVDEHIKVGLVPSISRRANKALATYYSRPEDRRKAYQPLLDEARVIAAMWPSGSPQRIQVDAIIARLTAKLQQAGQGVIYGTTRTAVTTSAPRPVVQTKTTAPPIATATAARPIFEGKPAVTTPSPEIKHGLYKNSAGEWVATETTPSGQTTIVSITKVPPAQVVTNGATTQAPPPEVPGGGQVVTPVTPPGSTWPTDVQTPVEAGFGFDFGSLFRPPLVYALAAGAALLLLK